MALPRVLLCLLLIGYGVKVSALQTPDFVVCFDFGCKSQQSVNLTNAQWQEISTLFQPAANSAFEEKQQIRKAVARIEQMTGLIVGTSVDLAGNYNGIDDLTHQQDCIDESTNTLQYLSALQQRGWLKWHQVEGKHRRMIWLFSHWTAVIRETDNNQLYAVDSWYRDNGEPPYLQPLSDWQRKVDFPDELNPPVTLKISKQ